MGEVSLTLNDDGTPDKPIVTGTTLRPVYQGGGEEAQTSGHQHVASGAPWVGEVSLTQNDDGTPDKPLE